jgi:hypothetical protein
MLEIIDDSNFSEFLFAPNSFLLIGKSTCDACNIWTNELLGHLLDTGSSTGIEKANLQLSHLPIRWGKVSLNTGGTLTNFKRTHGVWLSHIRDLPYNSLWSNGQLVKEWPGGGIDRLTNRLHSMAILPLT